MLETQIKALAEQMRELILVMSLLTPEFKKKLQASEPVEILKPAITNNKPKELTKSEVQQAISKILDNDNSKRDGVINLMKEFNATNLSQIEALGVLQDFNARLKKEFGYDESLSQ